MKKDIWGKKMKGNSRRLSDNIGFARRMTWTVKRISMFAECVWNWYKVTDLIGGLNSFIRMENIPPYCYRMLNTDSAVGITSPLSVICLKTVPPFMLCTADVRCVYHIVCSGDLLLIFTF